MYVRWYFYCWGLMLYFLYCSFDIILCGNEVVELEKVDWELGLIVIIRLIDFSGYIKCVLSVCK